MAHPDRTVPEGALVLLTGGRDEEQFVAGLYRVAGDLDLDALTEAYLAMVPPGCRDFHPPELPPVAFGIDPRSANPLERGFIAWLVEGRLIERLPTYEIYLDGGVRWNEPHLHAKIEGAPEDIEPTVPPEP